MLVNIIAFTTTVDCVLPFAKFSYQQKSDDGLPLILVIITMIFSLYSIDVLKRYKRENIRNFLLLSLLDTLSIVVTVVVMLIWMNYKSLEIVQPSDFLEVIVLIVIYWIKYIGIGYLWKMPGDGKKEADGWL